MIFFAFWMRNEKIILQYRLRLSLNLKVFKVIDLNPVLSCVQFFVTQARERSDCKFILVLF